jgi:group I intron endonuclease
MTHMKKIETLDSLFIFLQEEKDIDILSDREKIKELQKNNKKTYIYYSSELASKKEIIRNKIKYHNNIITNKIFGRKCIISEIDNNQKNQFLNINHIQGSEKSNICYGAFYNNELVAVLTFDDKRTFNGGKKENEYELSRFATDNKYIVVGIFSKMINSFIQQYKPTKIITFANKRWTTSKDNIYSKNGFKLVKNISQDYYYYKDNKLYHKFNFGKSQIKKRYSNTYDDNKTEFEMAQELGYIKIWDCGKYKYELYIDSNQHIIFGFIYKITNIINNKLYIGQTTRPLSKRISEYKKSLLYNENFYNEYLQNSFKKYGFENFKFEVIDTASSIQELNAKEIQYISYYKSNDKEIGYNIESGGKNAIPVIKTLEKMSKSHVGIVQNDLWINRRIAKAGSEEAKKYGKAKTDDEKRQLSIKSPKYWQGKNRDKATKEKISKTKKENGLSLKQKEVMCKKVYKINTQTGETKTFESTAEASKIENVNQSTISRWCSKNKIMNDILWRY